MILVMCVMYVAGVPPAARHCGAAVVERIGVTVHGKSVVASVAPCLETASVVSRRRCQGKVAILAADIHAAFAAVCHAFVLRIHTFGSLSLVARVEIGECSQKPRQLFELQHTVHDALPVVTEIRTDRTEQRAALFVSMRESYQKCRGLSRLDPLRETAKDAIISMTF